MNEALPVSVTKRCCQAYGDTQEASQIDRMPFALPDYPIQGFTARILENEDRSPLVTCQRERLSGPCRIEFRRRRRL
jgi:hypothetical protein